MSDCDQDDYDDGDGFDDSDDDGYVFDPNREYPREVDTNFVCVDASSLVPERLLKRGHDNKGVLCFLVRYQGFDEDLDDWVPMSELPIHLVDEFHCSTLDMVTPDFDVDDSDVYDRDSEDDGDYPPFVPMSQKTIKRELRALGCYKQPRKPPPSKTLVQEFLGERLPLPVEGLPSLTKGLPLPPFCAPSSTCESLSNCGPSLFPSSKPPPRPPDPPQSSFSTVATLYFMCVIQLHLAFSMSDQVCNLAISCGFWSSVGNYADQPWLLVEPPDPPPCVGDVLRVL